MVIVLDLQGAESGFSKVQASELHCTLVVGNGQSPFCKFSALWKMIPVLIKEPQCFNFITFLTFVKKVIKLKW